MTLLYATLDPVSSGKYFPMFCRVAVLSHFLSRDSSRENQMLLSASRHG